MKLLGVLCLVGGSVLAHAHPHRGGKRHHPGNVPTPVARGPNEVSPQDLVDRDLMEQMGAIYSGLSSSLLAGPTPKPPIRIATTTWAFPTPSPNPNTYYPPDISLGEVKPGKSIVSDSYNRLTSLIPKIMFNAVDISFNSWELGALTQSLLEVYMPGLTPFAWDATAADRDIPWDMLKITQASLWQFDWNGSPSSNRHSASDLSKYLDPKTSPAEIQGKTLIGGDGSLGDPCSLGMAAWVLAKYAGKNDQVRYHLALREGGDYAWAVGNQLQHLRWGKASDNGTYSMREEGFELWADMGFMIPPFLAYLGLDTKNNDLLAAAIDQWQLESSALWDTEQHLFRHINGWDARLWATGNGWMLMGALRVLASIRAAGETAAFAQKISDVEDVLGMTFEAVFNRLNWEGLVPNYMNEWEDRLTTGDTAGTALIVAAYYRFATHSDDKVTEDMKAKVARAFDAVMSKTTDDGWLHQVVDPMGRNGWVVGDWGMQSPEGQSFLGMMWAARTAAGF